MTDIQKAINYVADNVSQTRCSYALENMALKREPLCAVDDELAMVICDLMEEYGEDNGLAEGWWLEYVEDEDEVLHAIMAR